MNWLLHWLGLDNASGRQYLAWSGAGSDLAYLGIIGTLWRRHNCEVKGCWRLGRHATAAGHRVCRKHHPDDHLSAEQVAADHHAARIQAKRTLTR